MTSLPSVHPFKPWANINPSPPLLSGDVAVTTGETVRPGRADEGLLGHHTQRWGAETGDPRLELFALSSAELGEPVTGFS